MTESKTYEDAWNHRIIAIGVGKAGNLVVNRMIDQGVDQVEFIGVDTDKRSLYDCRASKLFLLGKEPFIDPDMKSNPETGERAAWESAEEISAAIKGADMVFVICGMGGTGSGIAPVVANIAKYMDILTVGVVTEPCSFEGEERQTWAREGVERLRKHVNSLILYPGDRLLEKEGGDISPQETFQAMDRALLQVVKGIVDIISKPDIIAVDFDHMEEIMRPQGVVHIGLGEGQGEEMTLEAVRMAVGRLMLKGSKWSLKDASDVLFRVSGDINLRIVNDALKYIQDLAGEECNVLFGAGYTDDIGENCFEILVLVKFTEEAAQKREREARVMERFEFEFLDFFNDID